MENANFTNVFYEKKEIIKGRLAVAFYDEKKNIALIEGSSATGKQVMMEN